MAEIEEPMQRRPILSLAPILTLFALTLAIAGCGSKDKGTNPMATTEPFESGNLTSGKVFVHRFNTAGSFSYRCRFHSPMTGTITVQAGGSDSVLLSITDNAFQAGPAVKPTGYVKWTHNGTITHSVTRP